MNTYSLNGIWKIRWSDGLRGGMPHYLKEDGIPADADLMGHSHDISDQYDASRWMDATVPGEIHLDLMKAGLIEDVYTSIHALSCRWVEESLWYYRRTFIGGEAASASYTCLKFNGLEYSAIVYLNGKEIARHANAFYPLVVNVSGILLPGENVLVIQMESGMYSVADKPVSELYTACHSMDYLLHKRMYMRKVQSSCGWDWSPRLQNVGIFGDVSVLYDDIAVVDMVSLRNQTDPDLKHSRLEARAFLFAYDGLVSNYRLAVTIDGKTFYSQPQMAVNGELSLAVDVEQPMLWNPIGFGEQHLYRVEIVIYSGEKVVYRTEKQTGFRYAEIDQSPHPKEGNQFHILINNQKVFCRGSNFVPMDMIPASITRQRYNEITDRALECNFNFLRVWGGGLYEADDFYELCDQKGILTWQEFIAACATVPFHDPAFQKDIETEFVFNVRRLSRYPSLIVWCGNNEMDMLDVTNQLGSLPEDAALYHYILPNLVKREDPEKYYQPCSPWSFDGSIGNSDTVGDQHPWSVGFADKDHRRYREMECRFANEGGVLGPVSLKTIQQCLINPKERQLHSFAWDFHDNMLESFMPGTSNDNTILFWTKRQANELSLAELVYLSGFLQGEGLKEYIESFRRKKFTCNAAIFWMFNDAWPCTRSWTVVDYYLRRTPAFYHVKRSFAPVTVALHQEGAVIHIIGINDTVMDFTGTICYGAFCMNGTYVYKNEIPVKIRSNASHQIATLDSTDKSIDGCHEIAFCVLNDEQGKQLSASRLIHSTYDELALQKTCVQIQLERKQAIFTCDKPIFGVCLDLDGETALADNMFDLYPGIPYSIPWIGEHPPKILYTLADVFCKD